MKAEKILSKALAREPLTEEEALLLYLEAGTAELAAAADCLRRESVPDPSVVTWQIDRNVNITNVCISGCKFCNFHCKPHRQELAFITTIDEYSRKIEEMLALGGDQLLLQGGLHPKLGIRYYEGLFSELKQLYPNVKLHALGPPEIAHISRISGITIDETLQRLVAAGLESLPGAGAEILVDEVRQRISPGKPSVAEWLDVMRTAHKMGLVTSATMMYGHVETQRQRIQHLMRIRDLQAECPAGKPGFLAFIPWIFAGKGTVLAKEMLERDEVAKRSGIEDMTATQSAQNATGEFHPTEYIRIIAISRIVLYNIRNIQASWLTVGKPTAQAALHSGANDMGSIMIEENVVSSAGAHNSFDADGIQASIREAGFIPQLRDQRYRPRAYKSQR